MNTPFTEKKDRTNATLTGVFFIIAAVSSIIGLKLYDPILMDKNFIISGNAHYNQVILGVICELILAASATGTAIMLYPYLRRYHESIGIGYLSFRVLEVVFIVIGTLSVLTALSISGHYAEGSIDSAQATALGLSFIALHNWTFILGPNFMLAINTFLYSYAFYKTGLIPKKLSLLGLTAACLIMVAAILELFGVINQLSVWGILLALPIATYEISLAIRLIAKGFNATPAQG